MKFLQCLRKHKLAYSLTFIFLYQLSCIFQGFDLTDEGWGMYLYQQIFKNPECVASQMPYWLTGVIGGAWNYLFPFGGFWGIRFLGVIMTTATFYLSYVFLRKSINSGWLLIGLIAQIMIVAGEPKTYAYNSLSAFFVIIAIISLWKGLSSNKLYWIFIGGFVLGINIFVRIPNIALLPLLIMISCYLYWKNNRIQFFTKQLLFSVFGVMLGIGLIVAAMNYWGYWPYFMEAMSGVTNSASDINNSHQMGRMLFQYASNYLMIVYVGAFLFFLSCLYSYLNRKAKNVFAIAISSILVICLLIFLSCHYSNVLRDYDMYFAQSVSYIGLILIFIRFNKASISLKFAALASFLMLVLMPLGSDQGIKTMWMSAWLALPLSVAYLHHCFSDHVNWEGRLQRLSYYKRYMRYYLCVIFIAFIACGIYKNGAFAYYDIGSRLKKTYSIDNQYSRLIFTTSHRANLTNELLPALNKYVKENDYLMVYNFMPGINYMTDTRSYVSNSWLWAYSGVEMEQQFQNSKLNNRPLPVVLRQHFLSANKWRDYDPDYTDENRNPENSLSRNDQTKAINDFLKENNYKRVWTNLYFEILLPGSDVR